jgi:hypothetical protein
MYRWKFSTVIWVIVTAKSHLKAIQLHPAIFLLTFNTMLTGTIASGIVEAQPPAHQMSVIVAAVVYQGLGWVVSMLLLGWHVASLLELGLGSQNERLGLFLPVASSGYTLVCLIGCSRHLPRRYGYFARHPTAVEILQVLALWSLIYLWLVTI